MKLFEGLLARFQGADESREKQQRLDDGLFHAIGDVTSDGSAEPLLRYFKNHPHYVPTTDIATQAIVCAIRYSAQLPGRPGAPIEAIQHLEKLGGKLDAGKGRGITDVLDDHAAYFENEKEDPFIAAMVGFRTFDQPRYLNYILERGISVDSAREALTHLDPEQDFHLYGKLISAQAHAQRLLRHPLAVSPL